MSFIAAETNVKEEITGQLEILHLTRKKGFTSYADSWKYGHRQSRPRSRYRAGERWNSRSISRGRSPTPGAHRNIICDECNQSSHGWRDCYDLDNKMRERRRKRERSRSTELRPYENGRKQGKEENKSSSDTQDQEDFQKGSH